MIAARVIRERSPGRRGPACPEHALEYDGAEHRTIQGQNRDNRRDAALRRAGWRVLHVSSQQVLDPHLADDLAREVLAFLRP